MGKHKRLKVAITCGDTNGIGLEVILKSLSDARVYEHCVPVIYASNLLVQQHMKALSLEGLHYNVARSADKIDMQKINVLEVWNYDLDVQFGEPTKKSGEHAFLSLKTAVEDLASNKMDVLVTAPIDKANIQSSEFKFQGHTEFLAAYANEENPLMILCHENLRVALVTGHRALKDVTQAISQQLISKKLSVFNKSLIQDFGINRPKIAVLGLNPHNGDQGLMGDEEGAIIKPAIAEANHAGILAFGPYPADGFFGSPLRSKFDGVLAMYHDQGLAPFKALAFENGVNFTAGLPIVRTSPDHGTAFDIAGKNSASESSFREAILVACDIYHQRQEHRELTSNPLTASSIKGEE